MPRISRTLQQIGIRYERYRILECRPERLPAPHVREPRNNVSISVVDARELGSATEPELRSLTEYAGPEAYGFAAAVDGTLAAVCWYWYGERYRTRGFVDLSPTAAKLVQITTAVAFRGRGIAPTLIAASSRLMGDRGFDLLLARIWHSNVASVSAFAKAGWRQRETITVLRVPYRARPFRFVQRA
jgi:ribosomal protein S18 acetylase RimI-like enzyme